MNLKKYDVEVPNPSLVYLPNWGGKKTKVDIDKIIKKVKKITSNKILILAFFGSAIKPYTIIKHNFLGFEWIRQKRLYNANDIDCLVVTQGSNKLMEVVEGSPYSQEISNSYEWYWMDYEKADTLHLIITSFKKFEKALQDKDGKAIFVVNNCELVMGYPQLLEELQSISSLGYYIKCKY